MLLIACAFTNVHCLALFYSQDSSEDIEDGLSDSDEVSNDVRYNVMLCIHVHAYTMLI